MFVGCLWSVCGVFVECSWSVCGVFVVCLWSVCRAKHLEVEVQENEDFSVTGLVEGRLDVVVQNVHLVSTHRGVSEAW